MSSSSSLDDVSSIESVCGSTRQLQSEPIPTNKVVVPETPLRKLSVRTGPMVRQLSDIGQLRNITITIEEPADRPASDVMDQIKSLFSLGSDMDVARKKSSVSFAEHPNQHGGGGSGKKFLGARNQIQPAGGSFVSFKHMPDEVIPEEVIREEEPTKDYGKKGFTCWGNNRFVVLAIGLFLFASLQSTMICYNATYISIVDKASSPLFNGSNSKDATVDWNSLDLPLSERRLTFTFFDKGMGFGMTFLGSMAFTFPVNMLMQHYGAHLPMTIVGIVSTFLTALTPFLISTNLYAFWVLRIFSGLSISNILPVAGMIVNNWATIQEKGLFLATLSGYIELSAVITMPSAGMLSKYFGWPVSFYAHAIMCGIATALWFLYYRDDVSEHPCVSQEEIDEINDGKAPPSSNIKTPVQEIVSSFVIWAVWIACIGNFLVAQFGVSFSPMYLSYVLNYQPAAAGFIAIVPLFLELVIKFFTGLASDKLTQYNEVAKLRFFNTIALLGSGMFFMILSAVTPSGNGAIMDVLLIAIPVALIGFSSGGYSKCAVMVSRQYSPFVMSIFQMINCGSLLAGSFVVPAITTDDTFEQWKNVFIIYGSVLVISNTIFVVFAKSEPAKWTVEKPKLTHFHTSQRNLRARCVSTMF